MEQPIPIPSDAISTMRPSEWKAWWGAHPKGDGPLPNNVIPTAPWPPKRLSFAIPYSMIERELRMSIKPADIKRSDFESAPLDPKWFETHPISCVIENNRGLKHSVFMEFQSETEEYIRFKTEDFSIDTFLAASDTVVIKIVIPPTFSRQTMFQATGWFDASHAAYKAVFGKDFTYMVDRLRLDSIFFYVRPSLFKTIAWHHDREIDSLALVSCPCKRVVYTGRLKMLP